MQINRRDGYMKLLYGTANPAKLKHMREMVDGLGLEITGLRDIDIQTGHVDESGNEPLENARIKALAYYKAVRMPVFSCDSGLYLAGVNEKEQPGVHVRRVNGTTLNDDEMIEYYSNLALKAGGTVQARYKNAICLVLDEDRIFQYDGDDIASVPFLLTSKAHFKRTEGFPLDSLSVELTTGMYYMDLDSKSEFSLEGDMERGFRGFFIRALKGFCEYL